MREAGVLEKEVDAARWPLCGPGKNMPEPKTKTTLTPIIIVTV